MGCDRYRDYARVWDGSKVVEIDIGSGYCDQTQRTHSAVVDVSDEVKAAIELYIQDLNRKSADEFIARYEAERLKKHVEVDALQKKCDDAPGIGCAVVITTGRLKKTKNINKGDTGVVFWKGVNKFNNNKISVGLTLKTGQKVYVDSSYVELDFVELIHSIGEK